VPERDVRWSTWGRGRGCCHVARLSFDAHHSRYRPEPTARACASPQGWWPPNWATRPVTVSSPRSRRLRRGSGARTRRHMHAERATRARDLSASTSGHGHAGTNTPRRIRRHGHVGANTPAKRRWHKHASTNTPARTRWHKHAGTDTAAPIRPHGHSPAQIRCPDQPGPGRCAVRPRGPDALTGAARWPTRRQSRPGPHNPLIQLDWRDVYARVSTGSPGASGPRGISSPSPG
jgi:hypothetical protein